MNNYCKFVLDCHDFLPVCDEKKTASEYCYISMNFQFVGLFWDVFTVPVNHP